MEIRAGHAVRYISALLIACLALIPRLAGTVTREPLSHFPRAAVTLTNASGSHDIQVWVADTPARHEQGLMFVQHLGQDEGMLFLFDPPQVANFWMKDTYISLDLFFIAPDGRIIHIVKNARRLSTDSIQSMGVVSSVLELAAGSAQRLKLATGDRVTYIRTSGSS
jgi:uncharacterized membrane protein (UPF0127 family)